MSYMYVKYMINVALLISSDTYMYMYIHVCVWSKAKKTIMNYIIVHDNVRSTHNGCM